MTSKTSFRALSLCLCKRIVLFVALLGAIVGCGGISSNSSSSLTINTLWAPSTARQFPGFIGSAQVTVKDVSGSEISGSPFCLTRSKTSFTMFLDTKGPLLVSVKGFRATDCSGNVLAQSNFEVPISSGSASVDVSTNMASTITSVVVTGPTQPVIKGFADFLAVAKAGSTVVLTSIQDSSFTWSVSPSSAGTIDQNGHFVASPLIPPGTTINATINAILSIGNSGTMSVVIGG